MERKQKELWLQILLVFIDILGIIFSFSLSYWIRFYSGLIPVTKGPPYLNDYLRALLFAILVWEILFIYNGLYEIRKKTSRYHSLYITTRSIVIGTFILMALTFVVRTYDLSRWVVVFGLAISIFVLNFNRYWFTQWLYRLRKKGWGVYRTIIIGTGHVAQTIAEKIRAHPETGYQFIGFVNGVPEPNNHNSSVSETAIGSVKELDKLIPQHAVDKIIIATPLIDHDMALELMLQSEKNILDFSLAPDMLEMMVNRVAVDDIGGFPLLTLKESPLHGWNIVIKRLVDILISGIALIILFPFFGVIALLIKRDSKGTVFYRQERIGADGRKFMMYKFRSMQENAESETGPIWASQDDPRRTKLGSFLRKYNIDELPQLINVLKGEMSLVGPRPERPHFVNQFKEKIPRYMARHRVKSGLTGWAQVNGWRGDTSIQERTKYDLYYIENWSLLFDIKILLMTFRARKNAY